MLSELRIRNFVLIDEADVSFKPGLNAITGESGAGKTILVDALSMVLGERVSSELIRGEKDQATIEAIFEIDAQSPCHRHLQGLFDESGLEMGENLILKRILNSSGKNRCFVNNSATNLKTLQEVGRLVADFHGQHDHQSLLDPRTYLEILDEFGSLSDETKQMSETFTAWREIHDQYQQLLDQERERNRLLDQFRFQVQEIERANLQVGEEEDLSQDRRRLRNFETINEASGTVLSILDGGKEGSEGVTASIGRIQSAVEKLAEMDPTMSDARNLADTAVFALEELSGSIRTYYENLDGDTQRLDEIERRLDLLKNLKNKYGNTIEEILSFLAESKTALQKLENYEEERATFEKSFKELTVKLGKQAAALSQKRRKVAKQLAGEITLELRQLGMEAARLEVDMKVMDSGSYPNQLRVAYPEDEETPITPRGWDEVHFRITTNPGEAPKTLKQVASGGEISRTMLAIKSVLSRVDAVDLMVFDEIDSGVGGKTSHVVGAKIKGLAKDRQVLCITHLAPIASKADHHLLIEKETDGQRATVHVQELTEEQRAEEVTRMMGAEPTQESMKMALDMLQPVGK